MIKIKSFEIPTNVIQSPMAGCTDLAFRLLAREYGMAFAFLEMVAADSLVRQNKKTFSLLKSTETDKPLGAQLVGCDHGTMGEAAAIIEEMGFDLLDLNLGCPVPKVVSPGGGSALLIEPEKARQVFRSVARNVKKIPATVKMRKGFEDESGEEAVRMARIAEEEGLAAVTVHGRTRAQGYRGIADWASIAKVKKAVSIPVIGNGDVHSGADAKKLMEVSGCDGVMIGRGSMGNPWIYKNIDAVLDGTGEEFQPSLEDLREAALKHIRLEVEIEGERLAVLKSRRVACWYFKNLAGASEFRNQINQAQSAKEVFSLIEDFGRPSLLMPA